MVIHTSKSFVGSLYGIITCVGWTPNEQVHDVSKQRLNIHMTCAMENYLKSLNILLQINHFRDNSDSTAIA